MARSIEKARRVTGVPFPAPDPLEEIEEQLGYELPERLHELAEKPILPPKKLRGKQSEAYRHLHHR